MKGERRLLLLLLCAVGPETVSFLLPFAILNLKLILNFFKVRLEWHRCSGRGAEEPASTPLLLVDRYKLDISSSRTALSLLAN